MPTRGKSPDETQSDTPVPPCAAPCNLIKAAKLWLLLIDSRGEVVLAVKKTIKEENKVYVF